MIIIRKKKLKIIIWKEIFKINKNYLKNLKIVFEIINNFRKKNLIILSPLSSSHHTIGVYKSNIKNIGWWENIIKKFKNFKIISISELGSSYGSSKNILKQKNILKNLNYKINYNDLIKINKNLLKKINIKKIYIIVGGSIGGIKTIIFKNKYIKKIKFFLNIASSKISIKNKIKNKLDYLNLIEFNINKKLFKNYNYLKNIKLIRLLNNLNYLSKNDIKNKKKKIITKNYEILIYKKKIFNYLTYKSNNFIKYFDINSYIRILKNMNLIKLEKFCNKKYFKSKIIIIFFLNDIKFNLKSLFKTIFFFLKKKKIIIIKILKNNSGHDSFLIKFKDYENIIKKILNYSER